MCSDLNRSTMCQDFITCNLLCADMGTCLELQVNLQDIRLLTVCQPNTMNLTFTFYKIQSLLIICIKCDNFLLCHVSCSTWTVYLKGEIITHTYIYIYIYFFCRKKKSKIIDYFFKKNCKKCFFFFKTFKSTIFKSCTTEFSKR